MGNILVIEDEFQIRLMIRTILELAGHLVIEAADGQEALNILTEQNRFFALIILDIRLPKLDGMECLLRLRQQNQLLAPVMILTAHPDMCRKAQEYGVNVCLAKPFKPRHLIDTANRLMRTDTDDYPSQVT